MARILSQSFTQDPIMGLIGRHRIQFTSNAPITESDSLAFPAMIPGAVSIVNQIAAAPSASLVQASTTGLFDATITVDAQTITIAGVVYVTRAAALSASTVSLEFVGPAVAATKLANFINLVNGVGDGTTVGTGAKPHPTVYAYATGTAGTVGIVARTPGTRGNAVVLAENCTGAIFAWNGTSATALTGGVGSAITATYRSSTTILFDGFASGDIVDVVTGHGSNNLNYVA